MTLVIKNPSANSGDTRDKGSIPGSGRYSGGGNANPLKCDQLRKGILRAEELSSRGDSGGLKGSIVTEG